MRAEIEAGTNSPPELLYLSYETSRQSISHSYDIVGTSCALDSWEAAMAAITFNTADTARRGWLEAVLAVLRDKLDAFVSYRMRLAAAAAEHARPRQVRAASSSSTSVR